jgi:DNA-binding GntR family transcriptional regulator
LCAEFEVSRSPIREALQMLADRRLIEKKPRQGYRVRQLNLREIRELYDVRFVLETFIMAQVCQSGLDDGVLLELKKRWTQVYENLPQMVAAMDAEFHQTFARAAGNQTMASMLKNIDDRIRFVRVFDITNAERLKTTCLEHLEILDAVSQRKPDKAVAVLRRNIEGGRDQVEHALKEALARAHETHR